MIIHYAYAGNGNQPEPYAINQLTSSLEKNIPINYSTEYASKIFFPA